MNSAEIKLDLFRRIDSLKGTELEKVYRKFISLLNTTSSYYITEAEEKAIDLALESDENGEVYSTEQVIEEAKKKYPKLRFK